MQISVQAFKGAEEVKIMVVLAVSTIVIIVLLSIILGMIVGIVLVRPSGR